MNPLGNRHRIEELARLLEGAVAGPASLTAGHAALAMRLRTVGPALDAFAAPRPEFRAALRQRLVAVATVQAASAADAPVARPGALDAAVTWAQTRKAQRRIGVTAGAMAGVIAFTGVGVAASHSLPGQPFYGLKRTSEDLELRFTSGDTAKGSKHLEFAATRLREVRALAEGESQLSLGAPGQATAAGLALGGSRSSRINDALADFDDETNTGRTLLESAYRQSGKPEPLRILTAFSDEQSDKLTALLPTLPADTQHAALASLQLVNEVGDDANQLLALGTCGGECFPGNSGPTLPTEPVPTPGATAVPESDDNGVDGCSCPGQPSPTPAPTTAPQPTQEPTPEPTTAPSPTPSPTSSSGPLPLPTPTILPTSLPTILPTLPTLLPLLPLPLPTPLSSPLTLLP